MRLGDWSLDSTSFFTYVANMNVRGTLRSTLASFGPDDVTRTVAQITSTHNQWEVEMVSSLRARVLGIEPSLDPADVTDFDENAVARFCSMVVECVQQQRHWKMHATPDDIGKV